MSLDRLNDKQRQAAMMIEGPLLILAGAGSGKTSTMTERIAYMIEQGISPYHLLAVTFTNKAAAEMRSRVEDLVGSCRDMWIMTFHSMCLRILRYHCEIIGYDHNFVIYDSTDQKTIVKNIIKAQNINDKEFGRRIFSALSVLLRKKLWTLRVIGRPWRITSRRRLFITCLRHTRRNLGRTMPWTLTTCS